MARRFEYAQAEEIREAFARHGVRYLFIGKSGAILLGYPDTTQDADLFLEKSPDTVVTLLNGKKLMAKESIPELIGRIVEFKARCTPKVFEEKTGS